MEFKELTDEQWSFLQSFMPPSPKRGRPRLDDRKVLNGILYVLTTGCRWADMPRRYGHPTTNENEVAQWKQRKAQNKAQGSSSG